MFIKDPSHLKIRQFNPALFSHEDRFCGQVSVNAAINLKMMHCGSNLKKQDTLRWRFLWGNTESLWELIIYSEDKEINNEENEISNKDSEINSEDNHNNSEDNEINIEDNEISSENNEISSENNDDDAFYDDTNHNDCNDYDTHAFSFANTRQAKMARVALRGRAIDGPFAVM